MTESALDSLSLDLFRATFVGCDSSITVRWHPIIGRWSAQNTQDVNWVSSTPTC